jgi:cysteine desulfurase
VDQHPGLAVGTVFLDYNATTPVDPRVVDAMLPYLREQFGNPSSGHEHGGAALAAMTTAREQVARLVGAHADEIVFTGSGSEANNLAIRGAVLAARAKRASEPSGSGGSGTALVVTQSSEHPAVLATCAALQRLHGVDVTYLPVDRHGMVDPADLATAITDRTVLVSIMLANNETGTIQPVADLARIAHEHGVLIHTDAAQAVGKIPVDVTELDVDLLTVVGHKMYAPKGIAALYIRRGVALEPVVYGGGQEHGLRAGTENVAAIVALGTAADLAAADLRRGEPERLRRLRDELHSQLVQRWPGPVELNGHPDRRLPNTVNLSLPPRQGDALLAAASGIAASTGSACHTGDTQPSPVLTAMGVPEHEALSAIRLSLGRWSTADDVQRAADAVLAAAAVAEPRSKR